MKWRYLSDTVKIKKVSEDKSIGVFEIEGLYAGYGLTLGNALRRTLMSSLPGAAVTQLKIKGVKHEFSTIPGVKEDVIEIILNFKKIRFRLFSDEEQVLSLKVKGEKEITAGDIETNTQVEVVNTDLHLMTLTSKNAEVDIEFTVERGLGYAMAEDRKEGKLPVGVMAIDAFFAPVVNVNFIIENMRVGDRTDYNRLILTIVTDGSIAPSVALHKAARVLQDHIIKIVEIGDGEEEKKKEEGFEKKEKKEKEEEKGEKKEKKKKITKKK